jgi:hypothetical protein
VRFFRRALREYWLDLTQLGLAPNQELLAQKVNQKIQKHHALLGALYAHAGITPSAQERQAAIDEFNNPSGARGRVLRRVADNPDLNSRESNRAFVLMEYIGYLRRNPDDPPARVLLFNKAREVL